MMDPWYKFSLPFSVSGRNLKFQIPHDVFSTQRIDEGTLLLLENLPEGNPKRILDMGCGYGALGLPVAARFPQAIVEMVDRDLLAVDWALKNAQTNSIGNVEIHGSLGFRNTGAHYDWILCNVPARIGEPFIRNLIHQGSRMLNPGGELRVVVIHDLAPMVKEMNLIKKGPRHSVYSYGPARVSEESVSDEILYLRDRITLGDLTLDRPFDLGGDDQKRVKYGLPVFLDTFPRGIGDRSLRVLCFRSGYGFIPLHALNRWPGAEVLVIERDLLASSFIRKNALGLGLEGRLEIREKSHFPNALNQDEKFDLILGELSPSADEAVAWSELETMTKSLTPGGEALILCLDKIEKEWVKSFSKKNGILVYRILSREGYSVIRISS